MHNNPVKRTRHKHSSGLSIHRIVRMTIVLIISVVLWGATISNIIIGDNITYGTITMVTTNKNDMSKNDIIVDYKIDNIQYTKKVVSNYNHYEGEQVSVTYDRGNPQKMYINDEDETTNMKVGVFALIAGTFTIFALIDIIYIIIFLLKFAMIRVFFN